MVFDPHPPLKNKWFFAPVQHIIHTYNTSLNHLSKSSITILHRYHSISPSSFQKIIKSLDIENELFLYYDLYCSLYQLYWNYNSNMMITNNKLYNDKITSKEHGLIVSDINNTYKELVSIYGYKRN